MKKRIVFLLLFSIFTSAVNSYAADIESRLNALEETIKHQGKTIEEQQQVIKELREELQKSSQEEVAKTEGRTVEAREIPEGDRPLWSFKSYESQHIADS